MGSGGCKLGEGEIGLAPPNLPWLAGWNYRLLQALFHLLPHGVTIDRFFAFLVSNHLVSTWIFAACFYWFWSQKNAKQPWRRQRLFQLVIAIALSVVLTVAIRPWIRWPAPARNLSFRDLYPPYLWDYGSLNSFPSHSTLVYFGVAAGLWRLNRGFSLTLGLLALGLISLPRICLGGHYPIDVAASIALASVALTLVAYWRLPGKISVWLDHSGSGTALREFLLMIWIFELGEGFQGSMSILTSVRHLFFHR